MRQQHPHINEQRVVLYIQHIITFFTPAKTDTLGLIPGEPLFATMYSLFSLTGLVSGLLLSKYAVAAPALDTSVVARAPGDCHTADNRACWSDDFDINTDYDAEIPSGTTRTVSSVLSENINGHSTDTCLLLLVHLGDY